MKLAHAQVTLQGQCRQASFGLTDQVNRQEPDRQGQLGALKHRTGNQRRLITAGAALKDLAGTVAQNRVRLTGAPRALKSCRPAHRFEGLFALRSS